MILWCYNGLLSAQTISPFRHIIFLVGCYSAWEPFLLHGSSSFLPPERLCFSKNSSKSSAKVGGFSIASSSSVLYFSGWLEFVYDFPEPFTSCILLVFLFNHLCQCLHFMVQVHLLVFRHQSYTVFIALSLNTPMVRADNKFACCLDVLFSITQTKIDSNLSIYIRSFWQLSV